MWSERGTNRVNYTQKCFRSFGEDCSFWGKKPRIKIQGRTAERSGSRVIVQEVHRGDGTPDISNRHRNRKRMRKGCQTK